jgi:putative lipase involved disintegration of autophagic bodies
MKRKYDQILEDVMPLLEANPNHKLYITGHSLGAALSTVASFFLSCEKGIQTPVTCINFASPRAGDKTFLSAVTVSSKELITNLFQ